MAVNSGGRKAKESDVGFKSLDPKDPKVVEVAKFAIDEYNKESKTSLKFQLVLKAASKETTYTLIIEASNGSILEKYDAVKEANKRLRNGLRVGDEIKGHKWFKSINWKKLESREIQPSFLPLVAGKHCIANFDERWTNMPLLDSPAISPKCGESPFRGFSYVKM
ncbi:serine threonine- kinase 2 19-like [Olea europaea subsp. europaea]|uniref:Serine threonine- kinase 2 19-like n=1 Tax=Olea europaea subsp. europaea TaxID=158383 RepID=A0A8S0P7P1_OLEEU|nr:serine threonine- kinase 2 19-like [Olea europaea subsp. europaea]